MCGGFVVGDTGVVGMGKVNGVGGCLFLKTFCYAGIKLSSVDLFD